MTDFIADLETELQRAAQRRRRRVPRVSLAPVLAAAAVLLAMVAGAFLVRGGNDERAVNPPPPGGGATFRPQLAVGAGYCVKASAPRTISTPRPLRDMLDLLRTPQREPDGLPTLNTRGGVRPGDLSWLPLDAWAPKGTRLARGTVITSEVHIVPGTGDGSRGCRRASQLQGKGPRACVVAGPAGGPFGLACFTPAQIRAGRAMAYFGSPVADSAHVIGIARDGVTGVRIKGDGETIVAPVSLNVFEALVPRTRTGRPIEATERVNATATPRLAILNGTTKPGIATRAARRFDGPVSVGNYTDQQVERSSVRYAPGLEARARDVADRLGISRLQPLDADTRDIAWHADVVVVLGRMR